jgi:hypothetical protein
MLVIVLVASVLTVISALLFVEGVWLVRVHRAKVAARIYDEVSRGDILRGLSLRRTR